MGFTLLPDWLTVFNPWTKSLQDQGSGSAVGSQPTPRGFGLSGSSQASGPPSLPTGHKRTFSDTEIVDETKFKIIDIAYQDMIKITERLKRDLGGESVKEMEQFGARFKERREEMDVVLYKRAKLSYKVNVTVCTF